MSSNFSVWRSCVVDLLLMCLAIVAVRAAGETATVSVEGGSLTDLAGFVEGDSLSLRCDVTGLISTASSPFTVSWQHGVDVVSLDGALVGSYADDATRFTVEVLPGRGDDTSGEAAHVLTINPVQRWDDGDYSCLVKIQDPADSTSFTTVTSDTVTLVVLYFPDVPPVCSPDGPVYVIEGDALLLICSSEKGNPQVEISLSPNLNFGPWSITQDRDTVSHELLVDGVISSINGTLVVCTIRSSQFPSERQMCSLGPVNIIQRPTIAVPPPTTTQSRVNLQEPVESTVIVTAKDPACMGWLVAFIAAAAVATLSIIINICLLTIRQIEKDRKKDKKHKARNLVRLEDMNKQNERPTAEDEATVNVAVTEDG